MPLVAVILRDRHTDGSSWELVVTVMGRYGKLSLQRWVVLVLDRTGYDDISDAAHTATEGYKRRYVRGA